MKYSYFLLITLPFLISFFCTPKIINFAYKKRFFDRPNHRKNHKKAIPRIGGVVLFFGSCISLGSLFFIDKREFFFQDYNYLFAFLACSFSFFLLGFIDDLKSISPFFRLVSQFVFASIAWKTVAKFKGFYFLHQLSNNYIPINSEIVSYLITVFWIVGVINSINWIDGMDGLLIGITCIFSITFSIIASINGNYLQAIISLVIFLSCIGFLKYNKYPAKIMTGDGGSYFLGFYLSIASLTNGSIIGVVNPFILVSLLFVPVVDMLRVIFLRLYNRKSPFYPDRNHIHFFLIDNGISYKKCLLIIFSLTSAISAVNIIINL